MDLSNKYNIPIIGATDSHEITMEQMEDRDYLLKSNRITYEDEIGNYMDFPSFHFLYKLSIIIFSLFFLQFQHRRSVMLLNQIQMFHLE